MRFVNNKDYSSNQYDMVLLKTKHKVRSMRLQVLVLASFLLCMGHVYGQLNQDEVFGKNRVQYHKDFKYWWKYETANFITHWYSPARKVAESTILFAEQDYETIQNLLEHHINDKIQIIVFKDLTDFKQSNLGTEEIFEIQEGRTKVVGNRIFVYSNGDHAHLRHQIREGIASVHINQMLQGNTIQEIVQKAFMEALPEWYVSGLISYIGAPYDYAFENKLRAYFTDYPDKDFEFFSRNFPTLAGHAMWNYIYTKYGSTNLSNLLYITRINRKLENGFIYVLGIPFEQVSNACYAYYKKAYKDQESLFEDPDPNHIDIKKKKVSRKEKGVYDLYVTGMELSPNGRQLLYVTNELGKYRVWMYDLRSEKQSQLMHGSFRNPFQQSDTDYPMFQWGNTANQLYGIHEKRDKLYLTYWDFKRNESFEQEFPPDIERIYSIDIFSSDTLLFSASTDGYTDLYFYTPKTRQYYRLTNDYFDDRDARVLSIGERRYIVFSSNRVEPTIEKLELDTLLPEEEYDLFLLSPFSGFTQRLTNSPWSSEIHPQVIGTSVHYISNENGIRNRWSIDVMDDVLTPRMLTNFKTGIAHFSRTEKTVAESVRFNENPQIRIYRVVEEGEQTINYTTLAAQKRSVELDEPIIQIQPEDQEPVDDRKYFFQTEFEEEIPLPTDFDQRDEEPADLLILPDFVDLAASRSASSSKKFNPARMLAYRMTFGLTDFEVDVNNDILFNGLNTFTGFKRGFDFPETGILMRAESRDLFENYIVSGGLRVPLSFRGTEFYLAVEDRKFQLDRKLAFYRKSNKERDDRRFENSPDTRNTTHIGILQLNYPFSIFSSVRLLTTLRFDRTTFLPEESFELNQDDIYQQRLGLRLEYVFDNTYNPKPNIMNGLRAKVYIEGNNRFQFQLDPWTFEPSQAFMTVVGTDVRHYLRLDRHAIFATRFAGATSFGSEKILYYMGGVRNWISPQYNTSTPFPASNDFAFEGAALDMRGFKQNIRNGSSFVLANAEIRIPFFNYFTRNTIKSRFLRNFQIIGFADAGTAWHGSSPNSENNPLNQEFISNPTSTVQVTYFRDPLVVGYGAGVRLPLLGYFLRLDYAWGFETRQQTDPIFYFSLGYDF